MQVYVATHLPKNKKIQLGSYYTPENIVKLVHKLINPYIKQNKKNVVIFDSSGGCGAFLFGLENNNYRVADCDFNACEFLRKNFNPKNVFHTNSLIEVKRDKFNIPASAFLIMIGNPPYNDITSEFKNGERGKNI